MSTNYTKSNNIAADGKSCWNEASQTLMQDMQVWNLISEYQSELIYADNIADEDKMYESACKILFNGLYADHTYADGLQSCKLFRRLISW